VLYQLSYVGAPRSLSAGWNRRKPGSSRRYGLLRG
jgi:hypothetical protein